MPAEAKKIVTKENHPLVTKSDKPFTGDILGQTHFEKTTWDFHWKNDEEPHAIRRKKILKDHPEIRQLFGHDPITAVVTVAICYFLFSFLPWIGEASWPVWLFCTVVISGTLTHTLQLCNHDISHNLAFGPNYIEANLLLGIFANLPTGVPSSVAFRKYHYEHHLQQGVDGIDTDIPHWVEIYLFRNAFTKAIWLSSMSFFYAIRPLLVKPRPPNSWEVLNTVVQLAFDVWVYKTYGFWALGFMVFGALAGMGFNPHAGHFVAEHFEFMQGLETYSYYGWCNVFNLMVGYHNEHHDFPKVPWTRLHKVHAIAKEYYQHLPSHNSYMRMYWTFLTDPTIGPWSRVKRGSKRSKKLA